MTAHIVKGLRTFTCDGCEEVLGSGWLTWEDAKGELDAAGWIARKPLNAWVHFCDACKDDVS